MNNNAFMAKMMGKCIHEFGYELSGKKWQEQKCPGCGRSWKELFQEYGIDMFNEINWSSSIDGTQDGEMTPEVRQWVAKEMREVWRSYVQYYLHEPYTNDCVERIEAVLSIDNFVGYMLLTVKEWAYHTCDNHGVDTKYFIGPCDYCHGTGLIPIERFNEARKIIEEEET
jgi:hypothetical protein